MKKFRRAKMDKFNIEKLNSVREELAGRIKKTPILALNGSKIAPLIPQNTPMFIKLELFQHTGSFKARGALLGVDWLTPAQRKKGIATFSGGNHALAISWAAHQCGVSAKVIMPKFADPIRIEGCKENGAEVILAEDIASAATLLNEIAETEDRKILHPFNDVNMAFGAASCGAEFMEDLSEPDIVILPVGGGGLIAGMAAAIKHYHPETKVIGVEPKGANSLNRSFLSGKPEALDKVETIADSLGAPSALSASFELARANVDEIIEIEDQVMAEMMLEMRDRLNLFVEPACAASLGAAVGPLRSEIVGKKIGVLACGSNISANRFAHYTQSL